MKAKSPLHEDRKCALLQWNMMWTLCMSQADRIAMYQQKVRDLEEKLALVNQAEINALYAENERLTNLLEASEV